MAHGGVRDSLRTRVLIALTHAEWVAEELWDVLSQPTPAGAPGGKRYTPRPGYGRAVAKLDQEYRKRVAVREARFKSRLQYLRTISRLVQEGLVAKRGRGEAARFKLSIRGIRERERRTITLTPNPHSYAPEPGRTVITIVSYDIPERERWKRAWVREVLVNHGYRKVHQSMWLGTKPLPGQFLKDARELGVLHHLEIFEVGREGTLRDRTRG